MYLKDYKRRGDNVDKKNCIRRGDNVDKKNYIRRGDILFSSNVLYFTLFALYFCRLDTLRAGISQPRSIFLKPVYSISE